MKQKAAGTSDEESEMRGPGGGSSVKDHLYKQNAGQESVETVSM